jgi:hypothetical protein
MNVFRAFFFFLGCAFVVAHRIVWYGNEAMRGTSGLVAAIDAVANRLKGAINDRGCAIAALETSMVVAVVPKVRSEIRKCQDTAALAKHRECLDGHQDYISLVLQRDLNVT